MNQTVDFTDYIEEMDQNTYNRILSEIKTIKNDLDVYGDIQSSDMKEMLGIHFIAAAHVWQKELNSKEYSIKLEIGGHLLGELEEKDSVLTIFGSQNATITLWFQKAFLLYDEFKLRNEKPPQRITLFAYAIGLLK